MKQLMESWNHFVNEVDSSTLSKCLGSEDESDIFFHATPTRFVVSILKNGLRVGTGKTFNTVKWSGGKVFLTSGFNQAVQWQGMIAENLGEDVAILEIKLNSEQIKDLQVDKISESEGDGCSFFLVYSIPAYHIKVVDYGEGTGEEFS